MIQPKERICKGYNQECGVVFTSSEILCYDCKKRKKEEKRKLVDVKPLKNLTKPKRTVKSEAELEVERKKKKVQNRENAKQRIRERKKKQKSFKLISISNLQTLHQYFVRLVTSDVCASCNCVVGTNGRQKQGGHCHPKGKYKSTALLVTNIFSQCNVCNSPYGGDGMTLDLYKYGCNYWGTDVMDLVHNMTKVSYSFDKGEREEIYNYIIEKIKEAEKLTKQIYKDLLLKEVWEWQQNQDWFKNIITQIK